MPAGRPTTYREEYVDQVVAFCGEGYSLTGFAGEIGVDRASITRWAQEHPEFRIAVNQAKSARARWWEDRSRQVALDGGPGGQATMVIFGLKNHAPEDYSDKTTTEVVGKDGKDLIPPEADAAKVTLALLNLLHAREEVKS